MKSLDDKMVSARNSLDRVGRILEALNFGANRVLNDCAIFVSYCKIHDFEERKDALLGSMDHFLNKSANYSMSSNIRNTIRAKKESLKAISTLELAREEVTLLQQKVECLREEVVTAFDNTETSLAKHTEYI